jgi:glycerol-3-phosphate dehydrogenase (NAD(P)+)
MRIGYLGAGSWGFALASLLAAKGHEVVLWTSSSDFAKVLDKKKEHPKLPNYKAAESLRVTSNLEEALKGAELVVESVTTMGIRPVFEEVLSTRLMDCPVVLTSKGIEQNSGLLVPEVLLEVLGKEARNRIGCLSGPSHAEEVVQGLPTSIVSASYGPELMHLIVDVFSTPFFRVYPNADIHGVAFGGAMKNIIAIACGLSDGLGFGDNTKAALMTRGLHEIRKLSVLKNCNPETLNGLSGMGDLCVTCLSKLSRNYSFGRLIAEGLDAESAKEKIGMVVEGAYTCVSALQLGQKAQIPTPITQAIYSILYEHLSPHHAVQSLLQRAIKEEHL